MIEAERGESDDNNVNFSNIAVDDATREVANTDPAEDTFLGRLFSCVEAIKLTLKGADDDDTSADDDNDDTSADDDDTMADFSPQTNEDYSMTNFSQESDDIKVKESFFVNNSNRSPMTAHAHKKPYEEKVTTRGDAVQTKKAALQAKKAAMKKEIAEKKKQIKNIEKEKKKTAKVRKAVDNLLLELGVEGNQFDKMEKKLFEKECILQREEESLWTMREGLKLQLGRLNCGQIQSILS